MEIYLLQSSLVLTILALFYWLFLSKETYFLANRWVLLGTIIIALVLPSLPMPEPVFLLKKDLIDSFVKKEEIKTERIDNEQIEVRSAPIESHIEVVKTEEVVPLAPPPISKIALLKWLYWIGFSIMFFRFVVQIISVTQQIKRSEITKGAGYYLATNNKDFSPFSFWKYIVINPNKYDEPSFLQILEHERIHIIQRHTFDLVLAELFLVIQWFNPLAWWHRFMIDQNLEYLVDQTILANGENKKSYQYHLVQVAVPNIPLSISSNYNYSQLKNRINMMNLQRSSLAAIWKYALLLPLTFLLLVGFTSAPTENENNVSVSKDTRDYEALYIVITEDAKIEEIKAIQEELLADGVNLIFEQLEYGVDNKISALKSVIKVDDNIGSISWPKEKTDFNAVVLYKNWDNGILGVGTSLDLYSVIQHRPKNSKLFVLGADDDTQSIRELRNKAIKAQEKAIERQYRPKDWKGQKFRESKNFGECSAEELNRLWLEYKNNTQIKYLITVDGIKWDQKALEIPAHKIGAYRIVEEGFAKGSEKKVTLKEIHIIRKAEQNEVDAKIPKANLDQIYLILTEEASKDEIINIQQELLEYGVKLGIHQLKYNADQTRIERFLASYKFNGNTGTFKWNKDAKGYNFAIFTNNPITGATKVGNSVELVDELKNRTNQSKVFVLGRKESNGIEKFLQSKLVEKQALFLADQKQKAIVPNWKGNESTNSQNFKNITAETIAKIKQKIKVANPNNLIYSVDGMEWDEKALDLPVSEIENIFWFEKLYTKYTQDGKVKSQMVEELKIFVSRTVKKKVDTDFIHEPDAIHYLILPCTEESFLKTKDYLKTSIFMLGLAQRNVRYSNIFLDSDKSRPLFIVRKFSDFNSAINAKDNFDKLSGKPSNVSIYPISQNNYKQVLREKSISSYKKFYNENY